MISVDTTDIPRRSVRLQLRDVVGADDEFQFDATRAGGYTEWLRAAAGLRTLRAQPASMRPWPRARPTCAT
jgi:hypothetical protein